MAPYPEGKRDVSRNRNSFSEEKEIIASYTEGKPEAEIRLCGYVMGKTIGEGTFGKVKRMYE